MCAPCDAARALRVASAQLRAACEQSADLGGRLRRSFRLETPPAELVALARCLDVKR